MKRRSLFGMLAGALGLGVAAAARPSPLIPVPNDFYRGRLRFLWTGWKQAMNSLDVAAQWVAFDYDGKTVFYASARAFGCGRYRRGDIIDITWNGDKDRPCITMYSKEEEKEAARMETLQRLEAILRENRVS